MKKRWLAIAMALVMAISLLPVSTLATGDEAPTEPEPAPTALTVYVSENGNDQNGDGTENKPYATITGAIEKVEDGTILMVTGTVPWGGDKNGTENDKKTVTITGNDNALLRINGVNGPGDTYHTHLDCGVILRNITLECPIGHNKIFACGNYFEIDDVTVILERGNTTSVGYTPHFSIIGGSDLEDVDNSSLRIGATNANLMYIIGGGINHNVTGEAKINSSYNAGTSSIVGGSLCGNVGSTDVTVTDAKNVIGGCYYGNVINGTNVKIKGTINKFPGFNISVVGGSLFGSISDSHMEVMDSGTLNSSVIGGCSSTNFWDSQGSTDSNFSLNKDHTLANVVTGNTEVVVHGNVTGIVYGGGYNCTVNGNTNVLIYGTVSPEKENINLSETFASVLGGGYKGSVNGTGTVYIGKNATLERIQTFSSVLSSNVVAGGLVFGGGFKDETKNTKVIIDGSVGNEEYGGSVFGGSFGGNISGTTEVIVNKAIPKGTLPNEDNWIVTTHNIGRVNGVYGGNFNNQAMSGSTNVIINADMKDAPVYGGSVICNVGGSTNVTLNDGAHADFIMAGCGLSCPMGYQEKDTGLTKGDATVTLKGSSSAGTIQGYETIEGTPRTITGKVSVICDGNTGRINQVVNADLVQVTNGSSTTIDKEKKDNEQLVNVADLTIDKGGKLTLLADAHITGDYSGDADKNGTLAVNAGKKLIADKTITNLTNISIADADGVIPVKDQIYVISGVGSTTEDGDFTWTDQRNGVKMAWKANENGSTQWWLVDEPDTPTPSPRHILEYDTNGGNEIDAESQRGTWTKAFEDLPTPVREGYTFTGWYADTDLTKPITGDVKVDQRRVTIYAGWEATLVPGDLNGKDHFAYIIGYNDGTVRPGGNITRAEVATIFFRLLKDDVRTENLTTDNAFTDVNQGQWFNTAVSTMAKLGIVNGRDADTFAPNAPITRAEFAAICARFDTGLNQGTSTFTDIDGHWAKAEIEKAVSLGWIMGYEDNTFRPNKLITRAEAATMINRVLQRNPETVADLLDEMTTWPDNMDTTKWFYLAIQEATNSHDYKNKTGIYETWTQLRETPDWAQYEK